MQSGDTCHKPIWTLRKLAGVLPEMPGHLLKVLPTVMNQPISNKFRERIMLAVATENQCNYCKLAHSVLGRNSGLSIEEISGLLRGENPANGLLEQLAITYVRDMARRDFAGRDQKLHDELAAVTTPAQLAAIESTAHLMNFANRFGNTFDAGILHALGRCARPAGVLDLTAISLMFVTAAALISPYIAVQMLSSVFGRGQ